MKRHVASEEEGKLALRDHVVEKALEARARHPRLETIAELESFLSDAKSVRFPTELRFDGAHLQQGEFAWAEKRNETPSDGYVLYVHPRFQTDPCLAALVAYHVTRINYGDIVTSEEAELFGSALLGVDVDTYYHTLCQAADSLSSCGGIQ